MPSSTAYTLAGLGAFVAFFGLVIGFFGPPAASPLAWVLIWTGGPFGLVFRWIGSRRARRDFEHHLAEYEAGRRDDLPAPR